MGWPFADERAFWRWAFDPYAELMESDEDLLLRHPDGLQPLAAAAGDPACPKRDYCRNVLIAYTCEIFRAEQTTLYPAVRAAADLAATSPDADVREWAARAGRLLGYQQPSGPVNRATAEQMVTDLFDRYGRVDVHVTADGKHWEAKMPNAYFGDTLHIDRRTGRYRYFRPTTI